MDRAGRETGRQARRELLLDTEALLGAAKRLRDAAGGDAVSVDRAVTRLEQAVTRQDATAGRYRAFAFDELDAPEARGGEDDAIALATTDIAVAGVLAAAHDVEVPSPTPEARGALDDALRNLDRQRRSLLDAAGAAPAGRAFAFDEPADVPEASASLAAATSSFSDRTDKVLATFVEGVETTATKVAEKLPMDRVQQALELVGRATLALPKVGRLLRLAVSKLGAAFTALSKLIGPERMAWVKTWLAEFSGRLRGQLLRESIERLLAVDATRAHVRDVLATDGLALERLDSGRGELAELEARFASNMRLVDMGIAGAALLASIGSLTGRVEIAVVAGAGLLLLLGAAIVIARDHGDAGDVVRTVRGVRQIADGVRAV